MVPMNSINNAMGCRLTRRAAIKSLAAGAVGLATSSRPCRASQPPTASRPATGPVLVEKCPSGSEIWQITFEPGSQSGIYNEVIYCEVPYCSRDSRYFVYGRANRSDELNRTEFMVVELGSFKQHRLDGASGNGGCTMTPDGIFYYLKRVGEHAADLMRVDLGKGSPKAVYRLENERSLIISGGSLGTVSPDHRWWMIGTPIDGELDMYGILLVDLRTGEKAIIDFDRYIFNAHPQFNPANPRQAMIQHNRGGQVRSPGRAKRTVGPEGGTLYLLSVPDGRRTPLAVGRPDTTPITGHQAWAGQSGQIVLSVVAEGRFASEKGNLLIIREGQPARTLAAGFPFNHVGLSRCGRLFTCDDWRGTYRIVIGSVQTGKTAVICDSRITGVAHSNLHPHASLTPDLKWVLFNSDRSGWPHVYAASVPERIINELTQA